MCIINNVRIFIYTILFEMRSIHKVLALELFYLFYLLLFIYLFYLLLFCKKILQLIESNLYLIILKISYKKINVKTIKLIFILFKLNYYNQYIITKLL